MRSFYGYGDARAALMAAGVGGNEADVVEAVGDGLGLDVAEFGVNNVAAAAGQFAPLLLPRWADEQLPEG